MSTPEEIKRQRFLKWPDMHPEDYCHRCGRPNISWWAPSWAWNEAVADTERGVLTILCPPCFAKAWEQATGVPMTWMVLPDPAILMARLNRFADAVDAALAPHTVDHDDGPLCRECGSRELPCATVQAIADALADQNGDHHAAR